ncbi:unnamed protein product, partial [Heterotrigona itama]
YRATDETKIDHARCHIDDVPVIKCGSIDTTEWTHLRLTEGRPRCPFNPSPKRRNTTLQKMKTGAGRSTHTALICVGEERIRTIARRRETRRLYR